MRILDWKSLSTAQRDEALQRPAQRESAAIRETARGIIDAVRGGGDAAVSALTEKFDGVKLSCARVAAEEFDAAERALTRAQTAAIERAMSNVQRFHAAQGAAP